MYDTVFITGRAKLAEGLTAQIVYGIITVGLMIDKKTGEIMDAEFTLSTEAAKKFLRQVVLGYSLNDGLEPLLNIIDQRYYGDANKAIKAALKDIYKHYLNNL